MNNKQEIQLWFLTHWCQCVPMNAIEIIDGTRFTITCDAGVLHFRWEEGGIYEEKD